MKKNFVVVALLIAVLFSGAMGAYAQTTQQKEQAQKVLSEEFAKYPRPHSPETTGKILNDAALRSPGWVLLGKEGGNRCPLPDGRFISCDFFVWKATVRGWDVIGSVGASDSKVSGPSGDGFDMTEQLARGARTLEDPVGLIPPPPPPPPPADNTRVEALEKKVGDLSAKLNDLISQFQQLVEVVNQNAIALKQVADFQREEVDNRKAVDAEHDRVLDVIKSRPIPDGCSVQFLRCRLTFNAPSVE